MDREAEDRDGSLSHAGNFSGVDEIEKLDLEVPGDHICVETGRGNEAKQGKWIVAWCSRARDVTSQFH